MFVPVSVLHARPVPSLVTEEEAGDATSLEE